jgi:hypothetical protein
VRFKVEIHINGILAYRVYGINITEANLRADEIMAYIKLLARKEQIDANRRHEKQIHDKSIQNRSKVYMGNASS